MDFDSPRVRRTYSDRAASPEWCSWCRVQLAPRGRDVVDIGCGGGIYARAFHALGARSVTGVDASAQFLEEARSASRAPALSYVRGSAEDTGLADACADLVFERAVIHHLDETARAAGAAEARRLLRGGGLCAVQDRTLEDVCSPDPAHWVRATLFETFPHLLAFERGRRPTPGGYVATLQAAGFRDVRVLRYAETRAVHRSFEALEAEILARKGKSILFELSDAELRRYCARLRAKATTGPLREVDAWTVWTAAR